MYSQGAGWLVRPSSLSLFLFPTSDLNHHVAVLELQNRADESLRTSMVKFNYLFILSRDDAQKWWAFSGRISKDSGADTLPWTHRSFTIRMCACLTGTAPAILQPPKDGMTSLLGITCPVLSGSTSFSNHAALTDSLRGLAHTILFFSGRSVFVEAILEHCCSFRVGTFHTLHSLRHSLRET
jgi:hypothetical protein